MTGDLTKPSAVAALLKKYDLRPSKGLGQNFLVDGHALQKIVDAAAVRGEDTCLEIGPGLGTLTRELSRRCQRVIAIEKDRKLTPVLAESLAECPNVALVWGDALQVDIAALLVPYPAPYKVVANLPYYITTPILMGLLESGLPWDRLVFLMQKEVAQRIVAKPGSADYGSLSVAVGFFAQAEIVAHVPPTAFFPPPKVSSTVLLLRAIADPTKHHGVLDQKVFFATLKAAFGQRRKTLLNALSAGSTHLGKDDLRQIIAGLGLREDIRGEALSLADFVRLGNEISRSGR
ncbi:MAG TPA: 16S rRNA (adenine(1518)-N(6)/adenine(1519)-N(6))-dimethyltransferase RsmA [Bacillota bacterium]|nr:16S rRNA (adenine(1518)-N(6)/adenine(1519)-N(6))-dimethyltransferase RsmA [Bacillota bacterium]